MPVVLTAGEQVDAFERVQSVSNSFCNLNSAPKCSENKET